MRPENSYDNFTAVARRALVKIASFYDVSLADTMAVCVYGYAQGVLHCDHRRRGK